MTVDTGKYPEFLELVASDIDIPPTKYQDAVDRYQAVGRWLEAGDYSGFSGQPSIYPQGSFRLGTVVRPIRHGIEASYDNRPGVRDAAIQGSDHSACSQVHGGPPAPAPRDLPSASRPPKAAAAGPSNTPNRTPSGFI